VSGDHDIKPFVRDHVRSVWALELLLALRRDVERSWSVEDLVGDLRASTMLVETILRAFETSGLVRCDDAGRYGYAPANALLDEMCGALESAYRERPVSIVRMIVQPGPEAVQSLADAFKFRGKPK